MTTRIILALNDIKKYWFLIYISQDAVKNIQTCDIIELEQKSADAVKYIVFLIDCVSFSPADIQLNSSVFQWRDRMPGIFEDHRKIIEEKTVQFQEELKVCNDNILEVLELLILDGVQDMA